MPLTLAANRRCLGSLTHSALYWYRALWMFDRTTAGLGGRHSSRIDSRGARPIAVTSRSSRPSLSQRQGSRDPQAASRKESATRPAGPRPDLSFASGRAVQMPPRLCGQPGFRFSGEPSLREDRLRGSRFAFLVTNRPVTKLPTAESFQVRGGRDSRSFRGISSHFGSCRILKSAFEYAGARGLSEAPRFSQNPRPLKRPSPL